MINVAIIGLGNIGYKRLTSINKNKKFNVKIIIDKNLLKLNQDKIAKNILKYSSFKSKNIKWSKINLCIISVNTNYAFEIADYILDMGINILIEKPAVNKFYLLEKLYVKAQKKKLLFKIGFNFIHDDAIPLLLNIYKYNLGKIYHIKMNYLYGTNLSNNNSVGSLLDVGVHLLYISELLTADSKLNYIKLNNYENKFYDEDGIIVLDKKKIETQIRFSFINWQNSFNINIIGQTGILKWEGLSKWKNQKLTHMKRVFPSGPPKVIFQKKFFKDNSFKNELNFVYDLLKRPRLINKRNYWDFMIFFKIKKILKLKYKDHPYLKKNV